MKTALLIIDIQNDYFPGGANELAGAEEAAGNAALLLAAFRRRGYPVVHIQHISNRPGSTFFLPDTPGAGIHSRVAPDEGEKVFIKHFPNSFRETGLREYLQQQGVTDLLVCGMMTHMCVDATVRAAKDFNYTVSLAGDACATKSLGINGKVIEAEQVQAAFLAAMSYFYATVADTETYLSGL